MLSFKLDRLQQNRLLPLCAAALFVSGRVAIGVAAKHIGKKAKKVTIQETKKKAAKAAKKKIAKRNTKLKEMGRQPIKGATEHFWQRMK